MVKILVGNDYFKDTPSFSFGFVYPRLIGSYRDVYILATFPVPISEKILRLIINTKNVLRGMIVPVKSTKALKEYVTVFDVWFLVTHDFENGDGLVKLNPYVSPIKADVVVLNEEELSKWYIAIIGTI